VSTDIKPGQVWAWNDGRTGPGPEFTITSLGEYLGGDDRVNYSYSRADGVFDVDLASLRKKAHLVTPAPLDAAKVKAGDTVTLENGDTSVRGPVMHVGNPLPKGGLDGFSIKNVGWRYLAPGVVAQQDSGVWTLTDHQPAPEPLPTAHGSIVRVELAEYVLVGREWLHTQFGNPVSVETMQTQDWTLVRDAGAMFA
jgi:hypothetical protein